MKIHNGEIIELHYTGKPADMRFPVKDQVFEYHGEKYLCIESMITQSNSFPLFYAHFKLIKLGGIVLQDISDILKREDDK